MKQGKEILSSQLVLPKLCPEEMSSTTCYESHSNRETAAAHFCAHSQHPSECRTWYKGLKYIFSASAPFLLFPHSSLSDTIYKNWDFTIQFTWNRCKALLTFLSHSVLISHSWDSLQKVLGSQEPCLLCYCLLQNRDTITGYWTNWTKYHYLV